MKRTTRPAAKVARNTKDEHEHHRPGWQGARMKPDDADHADAMYMRTYVILQLQSPATPNTCLKGKP